MEEGEKRGETERRWLTKVNLQYKIVMNVDLLMRRGKDYEKVVSDFNIISIVDRV